LFINYFNNLLFRIYTLHITELEMATLVLKNPATIKENPISYSSIMGQLIINNNLWQFFLSIN